MPSGTELAQSVVSGFLLGGVYAALSVGFSLTWGVTRTLNLTHPTFALVATYIAYWLLRLVGIDPLLSLGVIIPLFFLIGIMLHEGIIKETAKRAKDLMGASLVLTFGLIIAIENILLLICKADPRVITTPYSGEALFLGAVAFPTSHLIAFGLAIGVVAGLYLFLHGTYVGKAVQAVWQEREGAMLSGINVNRVTAITYGVVLGSAGVAGVCMGLMYSIDPMIHLSWLLFVFLVVVLGGVGSIIGSAVGGLLIGLIMGISSVFVPYAWVDFVLFMLLIITLVARPAGLFRR